MKRQIRQGCFETNSSSTHAICIAKGDYSLQNHIDFKFGEFGWELEEHHSLENKASYLITTIFSGMKKETDKNLEKLKTILDKHNISYSIPEAEIKVSNYDNETFEYYYIDGYIDHSEDAGDFIDAVLSDEDKLLRYLFGESMIITGNDNKYDFANRMYDVVGHNETEYRTYPIFGKLKSEFDNYEIYIKGN